MDQVDFLTLYDNLVLIRIPILEENGIESEQLIGALSREQELRHLEIFIHVQRRVEPVVSPRPHRNLAIVRTENTFLALDLNRDAPLEDLQVLLLMRVEVQRGLQRRDLDDARVLQQKRHLVGEGAVRVRRVGDNARGYAALESAAGRTMIAISSAILYPKPRQNETHVALA